MTEPDEFDRVLATLCAGFNVPCTAERRDAYGRAFRKLSPILFERLIEHCLGENGPDKMPTVRELWMVRSEMRARIPLSQGGTAIPAELPFSGDQWDIAANRHLLAYLMRAVLRHRAIPVANTPALIAAKNAWAADMRDLARNHVHGEVDVDMQKAIFAEYMQKAMAATAVAA